MAVVAGFGGVGKTSVGRALAHRLKGKVFRVREVWALRDLVETLAYSANEYVVMEGEQVEHHRNNALFMSGCKACGYDVEATGQNMKSSRADAMEAGNLALGSRSGVKNSTSPR